MRFGAKFGFELGEKLPNSEDCDSKYGTGLEPQGPAAFNPEQVKDFPMRNSEISNPKKCRIAP